MIYVIYLSNIYKYTTYNSGSVIRKPGYVLVFRREEWRKVLIHELIHKTNLDDALDVFAVHGVGGIFGTLMIALFGYTSFITQQWAVKFLSFLFSSKNKKTLI